MSQQRAVGLVHFVADFFPRRVVGFFHIQRDHAAGMAGEHSWSLWRGTQKVEQNACARDPRSPSTRPAAPGSSLAPPCGVWRFRSSATKGNSLDRRGSGMVRFSLDKDRHNVSFRPPAAPSCSRRGNQKFSHRFQAVAAFASPSSVQVFGFGPGASADLLQFWLVAQRRFASETEAVAEKNEMAPAAAIERTSTSRLRLPTSTLPPNRSWRWLRRYSA